jgi:hypothetical protein
VGLQVVPRTTWGARPWTATPIRVPARARRYFVIHYHGARTPAGDGLSMCRTVEHIHMDERGWAGVGYAYLVHNATGRIYEGRGWDSRGAHCRKHNVDGIGVYVGIGANQAPTQAALSSVRALYASACRRVGHALVVVGHRDLYATDCPGPYLTAWIRDGMPLPEDEMLTDIQMTKLADRIWADPVPTGERGSDGNPLTTQWLLVRMATSIDRLTLEVEHLRNELQLLRSQR